MADAVGTTHHVKIGDDFLLLRQGTYVKRAAPLFGARFTTGDPNYNNLSFWQHWAQTCWVGGMGAEEWVDDSMYDQGAGIDVSQHEVAYLSRDLKRSEMTGAALSSATQKVVKEFCVFNGKLYCLERISGASILWVYVPTGPGSPTWDLVHTFGASEAAMCVFSDKLWFGDGGSNLTYMTTSETFGTKAKPSGRTETPQFMKVYKGKMYVGFGRHLWRMKQDESWDGNTEFFDMVGVDFICAMELHQGFLYLASNNGHILRTDANITADLWSWDGGTIPYALRSYDGKLFIGAKETSLDGTAIEGVFYQFTGSSVTELKRWGKTGVHCPIGRMRVVRRHLFYGAGGLLGIGGGFGVAMYDAVEDAHSVFATNRDTVSFDGGTNGVNHIVDDIIYFGDWLFVAVRGHGIFRTKVAFNDINQLLATYDKTANGVSAGAKNGGWLESSEFDAGTPGLTKLWRRISVEADLPFLTEIWIEYSIDGGSTWSFAGHMQGSLADLRQSRSFYLSVTAPRFKYRVTLRSTDETVTPALRSVVVSYLPQGDPNWSWEFMVVVAEEVELLNGETVKQDAAGIVSRLEAAFREQLPVTFVDVDGTQWSTTVPGVLVTTFEKHLRYIGPSSDGPLEGDIRIGLIEAVEQAV